MRRTTGSNVMIAALLALSTASHASAQATAVTDFGANPAGLGMYLYAPASLPAGPRPIVVAMHGCTMMARDYEAAGWNELADELGFFVIYPEQSRARENSLGCFNWSGGWAGMPNAFVASTTPLRTADIRRGGPEVESILAMIAHVRATHDVDPARVYATGLSAGGGMTAVLLAAYPDVFAAGAIMSGIPYGCATERATTGEASACTRAPTGTNAYLDRDPAAWAAIVRTAHAGYTGPWPRVSVWHGTADYIVASAWADETVQQWLGVRAMESASPASESIDGATRARYLDASGAPVVERWTVPGMGHGTAVDPTTGCGRAGSYVLDTTVCSTRHAAEFFGLTSEGPIDPPADGGTTVPTDDAGRPIARDAGTSVRDGGTAGPDGDPGTCSDGDAPGAPAPVLACNAGPGGAHRVVAVALIALAWLARRRRGSAASRAGAPPPRAHHAIGRASR